MNGGDRSNTLDDRCACYDIITLGAHLCTPSPSINHFHRPPHHTIDPPVPSSFMIDPGAHCDGVARTLLSGIAPDYKYSLRCHPHHIIDTPPPPPPPQEYHGPPKHHIIFPYNISKELGDTSSVLSEA